MTSRSPSPARDAELAALRATLAAAIARLDAILAAPPPVDRLALIRAAAVESGLSAAELAPRLAARFFQPDAPDDALTRAARAFTATPTLREIAEALREPAPAMLDTEGLARKLGCTPRHARRVMRRIGSRRGKQWLAPESAVMSATMSECPQIGLSMSAPISRMQGEQEPRP